MSIEKCPNLIFKFEGTHQRILKSRGVDGMCFSGRRNSFQFDISAIRIKPDIPNTIVKGISAKAQVSTLNRLLANPLRGSPLIGIGSFPTDIRAKMIALNIMSKAIFKQQASKLNSRIARKDFPLWHKVYGGFKDSIRDNGLKDNPSMLILSNIDTLSTSPKIEKVRDILEQNPEIPRIVVVAGCDPMEFFATKLHLPLDYGFYVGPSTKKYIPSLLDI